MSFLNGFFKDFIYIIILFSTKIKCEDIFKDIKKLSFDDKYFVVLNKGLFLYNSNLLNCALITRFNSSVYKKDNDIIITKELIYDNIYYMFRMVNKYLFLFNEKNNITNSFLIDEDDIIPTNYYDLFPYKVENNFLRFILLFNNDTSRFYISSYKISLETLKMEKINTKYFTLNNIINKLVKCLFNEHKSDIYCFYAAQINNINYLQSIRVMSLDKDHVSTNSISNITSTDKVINDIKVVLSSSDKFFIGIFIDGNLHYFINYYFSKILEKIGCNDGGKSSMDYKLNYFEETKEFVVTGRINPVMTIINSYDNSAKACYKEMFPVQTQSYDFNIIYNKTINNYNLINHENFENEIQCSELIITNEIFLDLIKVPFHNNYIVILNTGLFL